VETLILKRFHDFFTEDHVQGRPGSIDFYIDTRLSGLFHTVTLINSIREIKFCFLKSKLWETFESGNPLKHLF
jgi:hypothetical protein